MIQKTFVLIKPDGVRRGLVGEILSIFERACLKIVRLELRSPTKELAEQHYPSTDAWLSNAGKRAISGLRDAGLDPIKELGTDDPSSIGVIIKHHLVEFLCSGEVVTMVLEGNLAISNVRRLIGNTLPTQADPGTIRGKYSIDSPALSFKEGRAIFNLVHASGNEEEAQSEINLWFGA